MSLCGKQKLCCLSYLLETLFQQKDKSRVNTQGPSSNAVERLRSCSPGLIPASHRPTLPLWDDS